MLRPRMMVNRLIIGGLLVFLWAGIPGAASADAVSAGEVRAVIDQASQSLRRARELGHGWTVTPTFIAEAKSDLAAGQLDQAMASARRALLTADQAVEQAGTEQAAWQARVPTLR
jgi:hypothetical protein